MTASLDDTISYSIVVPLHNSSEYLEDLLNSIPHRADTEVLLVDDHSSQDELTLEQELLAHAAFPNSQLLRNDGVQSAGAARNVGVSKAIGKWLVFADSDDVFSEEFSSALDENVERSEDILIFHPATLDNAEGVSRTAYWEQAFGTLPKELVGYVILGPVTKFVRRSLVIDKGIHFSETLVSNDVIFSVYANYQASSVCLVDEVIYYVRWHDGSLVSHRHSEEELATRASIQIEANAFMRSHLTKLDFEKVRPLKGRYLRQALTFCGIGAAYRLWALYRGHHVRLVEAGRWYKAPFLLLRAVVRKVFVRWVQPDTGGQRAVYSRPQRLE